MALRIAIGGDHAGFELKTIVKKYLIDSGYDVKDFGPTSDESCDYPDYAHPLADAVENGQYDYGILICGSGIGVCMTANKHKGIRAALCYTEELAKLTRAHNNANVLCMGGRYIEPGLAISIVKTFLKTGFDGGRHQIRIDKIPG
ncbi:ribose 5-phosphate isomerase B [Bacteroidota bacterium]